MEKQMRAERDRRAAILTAEGQKQSDILTAEGESRAAILRAEGEKQAQILRAEGDAQSAILRANGEAEAVQKVFAAIHESNPSQQLLTYQYLQTLPKLAEGDANKLWFIPRPNSAMHCAAWATHSAPCPHPTWQTHRRSPLPRHPRAHRRHPEATASTAKREI